MATKPKPRAKAPSKRRVVSPWHVAHSPRYGEPFVTNTLGKLTIAGSIGGETLAERELNAARIARLPVLEDAVRAALVLCNALGPEATTIAYDGRTDFSMGDLLRDALATASTH